MITNEDIEKNRNAILYNICNAMILIDFESQNEVEAYVN